MKRLSRSTESRTPRVLITTGDLDGIGWEVTAKALNSLGKKLRAQIIFYRGPGRGPALRAKAETVLSLAEAAARPRQAGTLIEIKSAKPPALWVEEAAKACLQGTMDGMVTAPLSKTSIIEAGLKDIGHTEILARLSGHSDLFMAFKGRKFNVVLATAHQPLRDAIASLNLNILAKALAAAKTLLPVLEPNRRKRPFALVGLNPHAGEDGLLGADEGWMRGFVEERRRSGDRIVGPLVPDAAFLPKNWPLFSTYICPYHDQGLIPFKMAHGFDSGVHLTLGLPFVRTSVDHGTAKELFGKNKADAGSMREAIELAVRLCKEKMS